MLLFHYRNRSHSATGLTPMEAMVGWQPPHLIVENQPAAMRLCQWAEYLSDRSAKIRDLLEELSSAGFIEQHSECPYSAGDPVLLLQPDRRQKRLAPYEIGWTGVTVV